METIKVNKDEMLKAATNMAKDGEELYTALNDCFTELENLHQNWQGVRFSKLVTSFNEMVTGFNDIINSVTVRIPDVMRTVVSNYENADLDSNRGSEEVVASKISALTVPTETTILFDDNSVEASKKVILGKFDDAKNCITTSKNRVVSLYNSGYWAGSAQSAMQTELTSYEQKVNKDLGQLYTDFQTAINNTIADMKAAEDANTVKVQE